MDSNYGYSSQIFITWKSCPRTLLKVAGKHTGKEKRTKQNHWQLKQPLPARRGDWITHITKVDLVDSTWAKLHSVSGGVFTQQHAVHGVSLCLHIKCHRQHASLDLAHQVKVHFLLRLGCKVQVDCKPEINEEQTCDWGLNMSMDTIYSTRTKQILL